MQEDSACAGGENRGELMTQTHLYPSAIKTGKLSGPDLAEAFYKRAHAHARACHKS